MGTKIFTILGAFLLFAVVGCSSTGDESADDSTTQQSATTTTAVADGVTASVLEDSGGGDQPDPTVGEGNDSSTEVTDSVGDTSTTEAPTTTAATTVETSTPDVTRLIFQPGDSGAFTSPTGNIACVMSSGGGVSCWIGEKQWSIDASSEPDCAFDFGNAVDVRASGTFFPCYSDFSWDPNADALAYGNEMHVADFRCISARDGVSCFNGQDQGFKVSRSAVVIF